jgi:hypothetical protein
MLTPPAASPLGKTKTQEGGMTVLIYVDTSKQVGDPDHLKVFANEDAAETCYRKMIPKAWCSNMRFWSEPRRPPQDHVLCF